MLNVNIESLKAIFVEEINNIQDWGGYNVVLKEEPSFLDSLMAIGKGAGAGGIGGITKPDYKIVEFCIKTNLESIESGLGKVVLGDSFISKMIRLLIYKTTDAEKALRKMVRQLVQHENRHVHQFNWLMEHPEIVDLMEVVNAEKKSLYGMGALEKDACRFQRNEKHVPFEKVFKKFLKPAMAGKPIK